jgi:hypothetical protein
MHRDDVRIPTPCQVRLEEMQDGGDNALYCERCAQSVHFLSAMTEKRATAFLTGMSGRKLCISYASDPSGNVLFAPEPRARARRLPLAVGVAAAIAACAPEQTERGERDKIVATSVASACSPSSTVDDPYADERKLETQLATASSEPARQTLQKRLAEWRRMHPRHIITAGVLPPRSPTVNPSGPHPPDDSKSWIEDSL